METERKTDRRRKTRHTHTLTGRETERMTARQMDSDITNTQTYKQTDEKKADSEGEEERGQIWIETDKKRETGQVRSSQVRSLQIAQANRKRRFKSRAVFASY